MTFVIGALGLVGGAFLKVLRNRAPNTLGTHRFETGTLKRLDLLQPDLERLLEGHSYSSAIIAAGIPNIRRCEEDPQLTHQCNVKGTLRLVEQLCKMGITPIVLSTDYVFDGRAGSYHEDSPVNALNEYGKQKAELERLVGRDFGEESLIIRLSKVYGTQKGDRTLIDEMVSLLVERKKVRAAFDQIFCPVHIDDVVDAVMRLESVGARGIYHVCGDEAISRLDLARIVCQALGASLDLIEPISLKDLSEPFIRPQKTDMSNRKVCEKTGIKMYNLRNVVKLIVDQYENK